jgi:hypothetical protein
VDCEATLPTMSRKEPNIIEEGASTRLMKTAQVESERNTGYLVARKANAPTARALSLGFLPVSAAAWSKLCDASTYKKTPKT